MSSPLNQTTPPSDRRATRRIPAGLPCCIRSDGRVRSLVGRTRNVSLSGALVQMPPAPIAHDLQGTHPVFQPGDLVQIALVPPATGLIGASELKPARIVRIDESARGSISIALHWTVEHAPGVLGEVLAEDESLPMAA